MSYPSSSEEITLRKEKQNVRRKQVNLTPEAANREIREGGVGKGEGTRVVNQKEVHGLF